MIGELAAFLAVAAVVIVTPGQDTALTIRNTLRGGRRAGVATALGVAGGQVVWTAATSAGLAALLIASEPAFLTLKVLGVAYLIWLGVHSLAAAARGRAPEDVPAASGAVRTSRLVPFRQGALSNLANPKMAVFFTSLLPQFAPPDGPAFVVMLALGLLFCAMTAAWLSAYAIAVERAGTLLLRPRVRRWLDAVTGAVLVALGLRLATESR